MIGHALDIGAVDVKEVQMRLIDMGQATYRSIVIAAKLI
jgi:hypothetical protein